MEIEIVSPLSTINAYRATGDGRAQSRDSTSPERTHQGHRAGRYSIRLSRSIHQRQKVEWSAIRNRTGMKKIPYLRSRQRRGRWAHYYKRLDPSKGREVEINLGVHGLHPLDPKVLAAWAAEHARWQNEPHGTPTPDVGTFSWAVDLLKAHHSYTDLAVSTRKSHDAIARRYVEAQGNRPVNSITASDIEKALYSKGGHGAANELKVLRRIFKHLKNFTSSLKIQLWLLILISQRSKALRLQMLTTFNAFKNAGK